jgi:hypothetical protein
VINDVQEIILGDREIYINMFLRGGSSCPENKWRDLEQPKRRSLQTGSASERYNCPVTSACTLKVAKNDKLYPGLREEFITVAFARVARKALRF